MEREEIKLMIVEDDISLKESVVNFFSKDNDFKVVCQAENGLEAIGLLETNDIDVCLIDIILPELDGYGVLDHIKKVKPSAKVIMLSELSADSFILKALSKGADYYMVKPIDLGILSQRVKEVVRTKVASPRMTSVPERNYFPREKSLEEKITNVFITVGIPAHIKGYQFLREAIKMAIDNPDVINSITRRLYPSIAERFDTSASKVERAIRHAIEVAWNRGKIENINSLFGIRVYSSNEKPTNGEFIALVADKMLIEGA